MINTPRSLTYSQLTYRIQIYATGNNIFRYIVNLSSALNKNKKKQQNIILLLKQIMINLHTH